MRAGHLCRQVSSFTRKKLASALDPLSPSPHTQHEPSLTQRIDKLLQQGLLWSRTLCCAAAGTFCVWSSGAQHQSFSRVFGVYPSPHLGVPDELEVAQQSTGEPRVFLRLSKNVVTPNSDPRAQQSTCVVFNKAKRTCVPDPHTNQNRGNTLLSLMNSGKETHWCFTRAEQQIADVSRCLSPLLSNTLCVFPSSPVRLARSNTAGPRSHVIRYLLVPACC